MAQRVVGVGAREAQSSAFLSCPGIEPLYSGVAIKQCVGGLDAGAEARDRRWGGLEVVVFGEGGTSARSVWSGMRAADGR